jgi:Zn-finger protein
MKTKITIQSVDQRIESKAREIHSVQMLAYAQEAKLLEAAYFPPLHFKGEESLRFYCPTFYYNLATEIFGSKLALRSCRISPIPTLRFY